jgi:uncharacterized protein involved in exopolysaccharide biosynthesis
MIVDTTYFLKTLKRRIWILIGIPLIVGLSTYFLVHGKQKQYKSTAQLSAGLPVKLSAFTSTQNKRGEQKTSFLNHVEAMKTEFIGSMVACNLLLHDLVEDVAFRDVGMETLSVIERDSAKIRLQEKLSSFEALSPYNNLEGKLVDLIKMKDYEVDKWISNEELRIERIGDTNFIKVEFLSENPFLSAFVVNTICNEYIRYSNSLGNPGGDSLSLWADLMNKNKIDFEFKDMRLQRAQSNNQNHNEINNATLAHLADLESQLKLKMNKVNSLWISFRDIKAKIEEQERLGPGKDKIDPYNTPKVLELQAKIDELSRIYSDGGSKDEKLKSTIRNLRSQLQVELVRLDIESRQSSEKEKALQNLILESRMIESQYKSAESNLVPIRTKIAELKKTVTQTRSNGSVIASLELDRDNAEKVYLASKEKLENAKKKRSHPINNGLKLMVMGQPNAEPESFDTVTIVVIVVSASFAAVLAIIFVSTIIRTPRRPTTPTFVITR